MAQQNNDFLRFSAYSFKDLITRKLSEDTKFTDQIYEGSNLATLIDLCAYLFQGLVYCINNAASESMFSDTQIYENINRIVKLIGYNPKGFIPSEATFSFNTANGQDRYVPQYSGINTGLTDNNGEPVYYSFCNPYEMTNGYNNVILKNGRWKMYSTIFTASGSNYETFVLDGVKADSLNADANSSKYFVAHGCIDVYVKRKSGGLIKFKGLTDEIFCNTVEKYTTSSDPANIFRSSDEDRYYSIRLNENKTYEIKFGNNNNGQRLQPGDQVYVFYLATNGFNGVLERIGIVKDAIIEEPASLLGISDELMKSIICSDLDSGLDTSDSMIKNIREILRTVSVTNITSSTKAVAEESVDTIRSIAPNYYKLGNRLITKEDFEYYIKNRFNGIIIDCKCFNNWDYLSKFFGWLYKLGLNGNLIGAIAGRKSQADYYINEERMTKYDYKYADAADSNNVYLWIKLQNNQIIPDGYEDDLQSMKVLTSEPVFIESIPYMFAICAAPLPIAIEYAQNSIGLFDANNENYIEITINDNSLYSSAAIKIQINQLFLEFFKESILKLGQTVNLNQLTQKIYAISGVQKIRTVYSSPLGIDHDVYIDGISFATWSSTLIDAGDDIVIGSHTRTLEDFQFPTFYHTTIIDKIKIIKKSFSNNGSVQY